jgi:hypothetical protein
LAWAISSSGEWNKREKFSLADEEKDEIGRMKDESRQKQRLFFCFIHPSSFILHPSLRGAG